MASTCNIPSYEDDDFRVPVRATFINLYKWPESDAEFVMSMSSANVRKDGHDRFSSRQLFLRSYPFTRDEDDTMITKCIGWAKEKAAEGATERYSGDGDRRKCAKVRRVKATAKHSIGGDLETAVTTRRAAGTVRRASRREESYGVVSNPRAEERVGAIELSWIGFFRCLSLVQKASVLVK
ncbi:hypothetical protein BUALT_Bualt02G0055100 [Buddleja alternifolia]|uniref:Uncharacterized protein n=1 Tax=Buddleja alternifolia TaxID=168488 RepID=A0AAV6XZV2_9LAMI|nr:hypothetical protein BUALT_Bualt02G0055100 [Buddleja alternifolia]